MQDFYSALSVLVQAHLAAHSINSALIDEIISGVIDDLIAKFGGQHIYLKTQSAQKRAERNQRIAAEFSGDNFAELCQKYQLTAYWLRRILADAKVHEAA